MLMLGELIGHPELGMHLVTGPDDAFTRPVAGVYVVKNMESVHWPGPDWIMLVGFENLSPAELQRMLINGPAMRNMSAVAIRTRSIPQSIVLQARAGHVTLLSVRPDVPLRLIGYFVDRRLLLEETDLRTSLRAAQWSLADTLSLLGEPAYGPQEMKDCGRPGISGSLSQCSCKFSQAVSAHPGIAHIDFDRGTRVAVFAKEDGTTYGLASQLEACAVSLSQAAVIIPANGAVFVLLPARVKIASLVDAIGDPVHVGLSGQIHRRSELPRAVGDALAALRYAQRGAIPAGTACFAEKLTLAEWLIGSVGAEELRRRIQQQFGRLRHHPDFSVTLMRWLEKNCNVQAAAAAMHIHANTVRYRLGRIEEVASCRLSEVSVLADLYLSLLAFPGELGVSRMDRDPGDSDHSASAKPDAP